MANASEDTNRNTARSGVGPLLRANRERLGYKLPDVAQHLRIRAAVLGAMEAGEFEKLPNGAYALGFVRTYADFLGLDRDEIARRVKEESAALSARTELVFPQPLSEGRLPSGLVMLVSILLAGGAYGLWYYQSSGARVAVARVEAVPEQLAPPATSPSQAEAATVTVRDPAAASGRPAETVATIAPAPMPQLASVPSPVVDPAVPAARKAGTRIVVKATGDSWLQVRDPAGAVVFSRILRPGETYDVPDQPGFVLATGSAGMLDIFVDGTKAPSLGRPGFTRKDVPLDPARLLAGTVATDQPASRPAPAPRAKPTDG
jgi:cytoskeleton protein RodZ